MLIFVFVEWLIHSTLLRRLRNIGDGWSNGRCIMKHLLCLNDLLVRISIDSVTKLLIVKYEVVVVNFIRMLHVISNIK